MADLLDVLRAALASHYTIEEEIGRGGMAFVYRARDLKHQRTVAIKVLRPELAAVLGPERFAREIQLTATLNHPRILAIHDSGAAGDLLYYVMPFVTGESLRARLDRERQLPVEDAIAITTAIASALSYAHEQRVVHRDIKPENIMLANGEVIVADFGIGRALETTSAEHLTETGLALGTPAYMSPEQASADPNVDGRSDQFSLGCVLFEMLVGEPPFRGPTMQAIIVRRMMEPMPSICAVRRGVPMAVEAVVRKSLEKAPADRFTTMAVFSTALTKAGTGETGKAYTRVSRGSLVRRAVVAVLGIGALASGYFLTHRAEPSIAIMAVHDAAPDHADPSLGSGLVDEIVTRLHDTRLHDAAHGIVVAGQTSVDYLQDAHKAPREIAAALKMRQVLSIAIRPAGGKLKVRAELQRASEEGLIWEHNYLVDSATNVVALADSVAPEVLAHLDVKVPAATLLEWDRRASRNQTAVLAYQNGRRLVATRPTMTSLDSAVTYFNAALRIDTSYAEAWSGLSDTYSLRAALGGIKPIDAFPPALELATKAVRLDTALAEAYVSLARIHLLYAGDFAAGLADIQRALHFNPEYADAHLFFGAYHLFVGDYDAA
ncbi:MAG: protein kinase, partial [Gemmatimonadota bacterium]